MPPNGVLTLNGFIGREIRIAALQSETLKCSDSYTIHLEGVNTLTNPPNGTGISSNDGNSLTFTGDPDAGLTIISSSSSTGAFYGI